ncbi:MAG: class I SAM-dependent methyltransferase [Nitriliruptorales bacterium]
MAERLTSEEIRALDPYVLMAVLGKRVIHPGGRRATRQLLTWADIRQGEEVLDIGCGVGTTAVEAARSYGARVIAADVSPLMRKLAERRVRAARVDEHVSVEAADITALPYDDGRFDCVIAEAVTMFVSRERAARELVRVCRPGGRVLATEFMWTRPPSEEARQIFLGEVCPGLRFDTAEDWLALYADAGLRDLQVTSGPFEMLTLRGFLEDEGVGGALRFGARAATRLAYLRRLAWLMPRMARAVPYLGYIVVSGRRPTAASRDAVAPAGMTDRVR